MNQKHFFLSFSRMMAVILMAGLIGLFAPAITTAGLNEWTTNGPEGGPVLSIAIDPATPSTIYAGTYGGVFKSTDSGATWSSRE